MDLQNVAFIEVDLNQVNEKVKLLNEFKEIFEKIRVTRTIVHPSTVACIIGVDKSDLTLTRLHPTDWVHFRPPRMVYSLPLGPLFGKVLRKLED